MGRPSRLTPEAQERFLSVIGAGAFPEIAARYAGSSAPSYYRYMKGSTPAHAAFRDAVHKALVELEIRLSGTLVQAGMGDPRWALTVLERRFPERWARRGSELDAAADGPDPSRAADDLVTIDPTFVEVLVPRLLAAGDRRRAEPAVGTGLSRFESRRPGRQRTDEGTPR
jgi:hypothetical protein